MREVIMENIRGIQVHRRMALDSLVCLSDGNQSPRDHYSSDANAEVTDAIFVYFIATAIVAAALRHMHEVRNNKKTVYMMKKEIWRDENGHRVALAATISTNQMTNSRLRGSLEAQSKSSDVIKTNFKIKESAREGDLWLLLMNEEKPLAAEHLKSLNLK